MRKIFKFLKSLTLLCLLTVLFFGTAGVWKTPIITKKAKADFAVQITKDLFNEYAGSPDGKNNFDITYSKEGLVMETGVVRAYESYMTACSYPSFAVSDGNSFSLTVTLPKYGAPYDNKYTDIIFISQDGVTGLNGEYTLAQFRIWNDSLKGRFSVYDNSSYWNSENKEGIHEGSGKPYADIYKSDVPLYPETTQNGEYRFKIKFDTQNFLQTVITSSGEMQPFVSDDEPRYQNFLHNLREGFASTTAVKAVIRMGGMKTAEEYEKAEEKTPGQCRVKITLNEVNGQSLQSEQGYVIDTVKPYISDPVVADKIIPSYSDYTYLVRTTFSEPISSNTYFYSNFANDVISFRTLKYKLHIVTPEGDTRQVDGLSFSLGGAGRYKISVTAIDESGNEYKSAETEFIATDVFRLVLGEYVTEGKTGETYTLPTVTAVDGNGSETDVSGNAYKVTIKITDPFGMTVTSENGAFKLVKEGNYAIRISAVNPDTEEIAIKTITVKSIKKESQNGCSGGINAIGCGFVVTLCGLFMIKIKKQKEKL